VRGFQPWPNAYTTYKERRLILWRAGAAGREAGLGDAAPEGEGTDAAGMIVSAHGDELVVACGAGTTLKVLELQPEGKQRLRARDFINGSRVKAGERFG
jgi:methionyl-tRNA formyltransferase